MNPADVEAVARAIDPNWWSWYDVHGMADYAKDQESRAASLARAERAITALRTQAPMPDVCPTCESPAPHLHPSTAAGGEACICSDAFHLTPTPQNKAAYIEMVEVHREWDAETKRIMDMSPEEVMQGVTPEDIASMRAAVAAAIERARTVKEAPMPGEVGELVARIGAAVTYKTMPMSARILLAEAAKQLTAAHKEVERLQGLLVDPGNPAWEDARAILVAEMRKAGKDRDASMVADEQAADIPSWIALNLIALAGKDLTAAQRVKDEAVGLLRPLVEALAAADEDGLTEHAEPMIAARAFLAQHGGKHG